MATWLADMADLPGIEIKMEGGGWASGRLDWAKEKRKGRGRKERKKEWVEGKENGPKEKYFGPMENQEFKGLSEFQKLN